MDAVRRIAARWSVVAIAILAMPHGGPAQQGLPPRGATALCRDGTYSFSKHHGGTCSHHGGVAFWLDARDTTAAPVGATREQLGPSCGTNCGTERWLVKTLSDPDRDRLHARPVDATVEELVALQRPAVLSPVARAEPVEVTVYRVEARLLSLFAEADGDYHMVLASPRDGNFTMIAEVPDPGCAGACASGLDVMNKEVENRGAFRRTFSRAEHEPNAATLEERQVRTGIE